MALRSYSQLQSPFKEVTNYEIKNEKHFLDTFFKVINQCDGAVELSLPEGGSVNLKSKLSQYFSMATVFSNGSIKELSLTTHNDEDSKRLIQYMVQGC